MTESNERLGELAAESLREALEESLLGLRRLAEQADETWELWLAVPAFMRVASCPGTEAALAQARAIARKAVDDFERQPFRWVSVVLDLSDPYRASLCLEVAVG